MFAGKDNANKQVTTSLIYPYVCVYFPLCFLFVSLLFLFLYPFRLQFVTSIRIIHANFATEKLANNP